MKKIVKVVLDRAEGLASECVRREISGDGIPDAVMKVLRDWGRTAPKNGGYNKTDFEVHWEGDTGYSGRYDMEFGGTEGGETFWAALRRRLNFGSCRQRPDHFKDNHWAHFVDQASQNGRKAACEEILDTCEVPF
jgi:hypothetical protein